MPQMNKCGKFIFGKSLIRDDLTIHLPTQALTEYNATAEGEFVKYKERSYCWKEPTIMRAKSKFTEQYLQILTEIS